MALKCVQRTTFPQVANWILLELVSCIDMKNNRCHESGIGSLFRRFPRRLNAPSMSLITSLHGLCSTEKRLMSLCVGCGNQIHDQYILRVSPDLEWHAACLKCAECNQYLDESCTCFVRDGKTYCKRDYVRYCGGFFLLLHKENKWKLKCWINDNMEMYLDIYCYNLDGY